MSIAIVPMQQVFLPPEPTPQQRSDSQRLNAVANNADVRDAAADAVQAQTDNAPTASANPNREPVASVHTSQGDAAVMVWDVNGDGAKDAVLRDTASGATTALLNRGGDAAPQLTGPAISIDAPTAKDLDRLALNGPATDRRFLAADFDGDGTRQLAVQRSSGEWMSLGGSQDAPGVAPIDQAEAQFIEFITRMVELLPHVMQVRGLFDTGADWFGGEDWDDAMGNEAEGIPFGYDTATPLLGDLVPSNSTYPLLFGALMDDFQRVGDDDEDDDEGGGDARAEQESAYRAPPSPSPAPSSLRVLPALGDATS